MTRRTAIVALIGLIGAITAALLLLHGHRSDSEPWMWPQKGVYIDPYSTINNPNNQ